MDRPTRGVAFLRAITINFPNEYYKFSAVKTINYVVETNVWRTATVQMQYWWFIDSRPPGGKPINAQFNLPEKKKETEEGLLSLLISNGLR